MSSAPSNTPLFSISRVWIITGNTFTHLARMKIFYFLVIFVLIWLALNIFTLPHNAGPESVGGTGGEELRILKAPLVGTMKLFALIMGVVATALLIPRDMEDRTLYTLLAKPVTRLDYLLGKLLGVLLLIFSALLVMTILLDFVLWHRTQKILIEFDNVSQVLVEQGNWTPADQAEERAELLSHGVTWSLQGAILILFFEAAIIAGLALLMSTFTSSTLFTVVFSILIYFAGNFIADGFDQLRSSSGSAAALTAKALLVAIPDYRPFKIVDEVLSGQSLPLDILGRLAISTVLYTSLYVVLSWFLFSKKEI